LNQKNYQSVKQLEKEDFIFFSRNYSYDYFELIISIFQDQGFTPKVINRSVDLNTIFRLVENKMGLAIVPSVLKMGFDLDIRFIELKNVPQRTILSAVWKESNRNPVLPKFLDLVKAI
jgi:DNA-binding transcriptional LysR family regulator